MFKSKTATSIPKNDNLKRLQSDAYKLKTQQKWNHGIGPEASAEQIHAFAQQAVVTYRADTLNTNRLAPSKASFAIAEFTDRFFGPDPFAPPNHGLDLRYTPAALFAVVETVPKLLAWPFAAPILAVKNTKRANEWEVIAERALNLGDSTKVG